MPPFLPILAEPPRFSLPEMLLFIALVFTSAWLFWRRFGPILGKILQSKKDPDFHLFPIGKRVWDFVWEVLLQAKVIRERPLAGLAHALVFWSFCAFALVTLNHCAVVFGLGFLDPAGRVGRFYFDFAAIFAIGCAVGILGLLVRRFLVRPKWLGEISWGSGLVALLIFALMATYLAAFFVTAPAGAVQGTGAVYTLSRNTNSSFKALNEALATGGQASFAKGDIVLSGLDATRANALARKHAVAMQAVAKAPADAVATKKPRLGLYRPWMSSIDEGWTRWLLEQTGFVYAPLENKDIQAGDPGRRILGERYLT